MKNEKFFQSKTVQKGLLSWIVFATFVTLYVIFFIPIIKNIESSFILFIIGFGAGIIMLIISEIIVELFGYPELVKYKNRRMLKKIREDRPGQMIHKVLKYYKNGYGFYNVEVDMQGSFFETTVRHIRQILPYPIKEYEKLTEIQKSHWQMDNI